jgi:DNA repair exonuclease SbcCD ATPase subunit
MNNNIKLEIEKYVMEEFKFIKTLDPTEDRYGETKNRSVKDINTLIELLQKEDINNESSRFNTEKLKNEIAKIEKDHELSLKKLESEIDKNKNTLDLEKEKIKNCYEIDIKKIENDSDKVDNEIRKVNYDHELNEKKLESEISKLENEVMKIKNDYEINKEKINNEYEINKEKIKIESKKNEDNSQLENRKINCTENKNNSDIDLKNKELKMNAEKDIELRTDRIIKVLVDGAVVLVPIIFYNVWMNKGFKFEETGTFTSNTFKNMFSKFKPTK